MVALTKLSLEENNINVINSQNESWDLSLTHLNIARNQFREINSSAFQGLHTLQFLDLSGNIELRVIDENTFANVPFLKMLDLSGTSITDLHAIHHLPFLTSLILQSAYCPSHLIQPGNLGNETPSLAELNLVDAELFTSKLWDPNSKTSSFLGLYRLSRLELSKNALFPLPVGLFKNLSNLNILRLDDCKIHELNIGVLDDLRNLSQLDLANNLFVFLPRGVFDKIKNLKELILDGNQLSYLDSNLFKFNMDLTYLDISNNNLAGLNKSTFESLDRLRVLDLAYNPLVCNCDLKWLHSWLKGSVEIVNSLDTTCLYTPATLAPFGGKQLITFDPSKDCAVNIALYCGLSVVVVMLLLILGLAYYHRWWIGYQLFLFKLCFIGYNEIREDVPRGNFLYDIAIMLHEDDEEWVDEHLRPALAERLPDYDRIVCGDNELMIGMHYLDAVHYVVEKSFKTIFVISRAALRDQWYLLKFRTALEYINDVATEKMTLLFVEDIGHEELPFLIRLFLSDHRPYLVWSDNERGQHYLWEELVKVVTVNLRCNNLVPP
ncbi:slit homolog 1 protein-like [Lytechinus variegatus]|uniref:slit homolog 1 protein-like n=1 Tax=Lytechinus variegatus TaxID=7654 RepID=UPI001BB1AEE7|nr:slit homolog 1 protein-like [Lytechinus variegatus]